MKYRLACIISCLMALTSCGSYFNQPVTQERARTGETTPFTNSLKQLPLPKEPVVVGVYGFKDQTGQYKMIENGSSFSTAVTQGATSVLIKALEDSRWFTTIERENLSNLLNERQIIRNTRQEYSGAPKNGQSPVPPLLYAGVLLEGGIISYDTNILTGGFGARYFGVGASSQYKQDRITVYLRAISTSSGKILKNVYVSKTILSQAVDANLFRYVKFQRLLEVETGFTKNEPVQLAVKEAVEKAVEALIVEGIEDNLWVPADPAAGEKLVNDYNAEKAEEEQTRLYNRDYMDWTYENAFSLDLGANRFAGDYPDKNFGFLGRLAYKRKFTPHFGLSLGGSLMDMHLGNDNDSLWAAADLNLEIDILPYDNFGTYVYGGPGILMDLNKEDPFNPHAEYFKLQYGVGLKYAVSPKIEFRLFAEHNITFSDEVDGVTNGNLNDYYYNFGAGIHFYFGKRGEEKETQSDTELPLPEPSMQNTNPNPVNNEK